MHSGKFVSIWGRWAPICLSSADLSRAVVSVIQAISGRHQQLELPPTNPDRAPSIAPETVAAAQPLTGVATCSLSAGPISDDELHAS